MSTANRLAGAVLPSFMKLKTSSRNGFTHQTFSDTSMKVGTVVAAYAPSDKGNFSQSVWEYDVAAMTSHGMESATTTVYRNCHMQSYFGGVADKCLWTPNVQVNEKDANGNPTSKITSPGTTVLIECVQGITFYGIIMGAVQPEGAGPETADFGDGKGGMVPTYAWQYNGVRVDINKDGEVTVTRKGPTKPDGSFVNGPSATPPTDGFTKANTTDNDSGANASVMFAKDGGITVQTGDGKNSIAFDAGGGKITVTADKEMDLVVSQGDLNMSCGASKKVKISDGVGTFQMSNGQFQLKGSAAELIDQLCTLTQTLLTTTVMTSLGPQPFDVATIQGVAQVFAQLQALKGS